MTEGQTVRWLNVAMGTENDMHTPIYTNQVRIISGYAARLLSHEH